MEAPALFCWMQVLRPAVCDDDVPQELGAWMERQTERERNSNLKTFGIFSHDQIGGYFEAAMIGAGETGDGISDALAFFAECRIVIKKDFFRSNITSTALNLCLQAVFADATETCFFPVFAHNTRLKELFYAAGCQRIGLIAPRLQDGQERQMEMLAITSREWEASNRKFLDAQAAYGEQRAGVEAGNRLVAMGI